FSGVNGTPARAEAKISSGRSAPPVPTYATLRAPEPAIAPAPPWASASSSAPVHRDSPDTTAARSGLFDAAISSSSEILIRLLPECRAPRYSARPVVISIFSKTENSISAGLGARIDQPAGPYRTHPRTP